MKFRNYLDKLNQLAQERPESLDFDVITSKDDEGNGFDRVHYSPSVGLFENGEYESRFGDSNAVCLN